MDWTPSALPRPDGQGLEKLPRMRDTRSGTEEKTQTTSMGWHSSYEKKLKVVSSAAPPSPVDLFPSGFQRDHTSLSFKSMHQPHHDHDDEELEQFYEQLDSIIAKTPKNNRTIGLPK